MKMTIRFEGGKELAEALDQLPRRVQKRTLREALVEGAEPMRDAIQLGAVRGSVAPHIKENIVIASARPTEAQGQFEAGVSVGPAKGYFYGRFLEFGTIHMRPRAFMRPGFDRTVQQSLGIIGKALWRELAAKGIHRSAVGSGPVTGGPGGATL